MFATFRLRWESDCKYRHGNCTERKIDVENPAPAEVGGEISAYKRSRYARHPEECTKKSLVTSAFPKRDDVTNYRLRGDHETPSADALNRTECHQLGHVLTQSAEHRTREKNHYRRLQHDLSPVQISQLSIHGSNDGLGEQIACNHPSQTLETAQFTDDCRQRRGNNCAIKCREQHREHEPAECNQNLSMG